ncbi:MAG: YqgE/AlgH family protein [Gammaproteobacteria bacterium]
MRLHTRIIWFLICWPLSAGPGWAEQPAAGQFLIASRDLQGETFRKTVILLLDYSETGAMGLIVNRQTELTRADLLANGESEGTYTGKVYLGGPVETDSLRVLQRTTQPPENSLEVLDGMHMISINETRLVNLAGDEKTLRFYLGYSGWGPGQLDKEIARGSWHLAPATVEMVFARDPRDTWQQLVPAEQFLVLAAPAGNKIKTPN